MVVVVVVVVVVVGGGGGAAAADRPLLVQHESVQPHAQQTDRQPFFVQVGSPKVESSPTACSKSGLVRWCQTKRVSTKCSQPASQPATLQNEWKDTFAGR